MTERRSHMSRDGRVTIPKDVRDALGLKTGDMIRFRVGATGTVTIDKVRSNGDDPFAAFGEWSSEEDETLYRGL